MLSCFSITQNLFESKTEFEKAENWNITLKSILLLWRVEFDILLHLDLNPPAALCGGTDLEKVTFFSSIEFPHEHSDLHNY